MDVRRDHPMRRRTQQVIRRLLLAIGLAMIACSRDGGPTSPDGLPGSTPGTFASDPSSAELAVSDIANFWSAFDEYRRTKSTLAFQSAYLHRASSGLVDFATARNISAASLAQMVDAFPRYFAASRAASMSLANGAVNAQVRAGYVAIKALYPAAVFPTVTFAVGRFSTGGTIANNRILTGSEFYTANEGVPTDELGAFQRTNVKPLSTLPIIVAHEHVHILQSRGGGLLGRNTLLEQSLAEGIADFIGELVSGGNINEWQRPYALAHEHELWAQFKSQMSGTDVTQWLYNQGTASGERPGDLGYFIGYRIAQSYYVKTIDKTQAIKDIIEVQNATTFLAASGYNP
ncbi:MAG: hypothetical protein IPP90_22025 [Gemmatimonadaceae bacterium]|nr:hypothetical protein [Gemmatimonadaceae bacterium]